MGEFIPGNLLIAPQTEEGAAYGAAILAMVGVDAYSNIEAALEILSPVHAAIQPQKVPVYKSTFKQYKQLYEVLKSVRC